MTSCFICWYGSVYLHSKKLLNNIVKVCSKVVGVERNLYIISLAIMLKRAREIMSDIDHVLSMYYELLTSGRHYRCLKV